MLEKFVVYQLQDILTSDMYRERFEEQLKLRIEALKAKKKDAGKIKSDINKLSTQKEKLLNLMLEENDKLIEKITIHEFSVPGEKEVCLNIVIDLKIPGYAPKYALQFKQDLKNREKEDKKKKYEQS